LFLTLSFFLIHYSFEFFTDIPYSLLRLAAIQILLATSAAKPVHEIGDKY